MWQGFQLGESWLGYWVVVQMGAELGVETGMGQILQQEEGEEERSN